MAPSRSFAFALLLLAGAFLSGCDGGRIIRGVGDALTTDAGLAAKGAEMHLKIVKEMPVYDHSALSAYVDRVGQRVAQAANTPDTAYRFYVLDGGGVNALSLPGGYVYVERGLIVALRTEDQLASVIGHEIAHITLGHSASRIRTRGGSEILGGMGKTGGMVVGILTLNPLLLFGSAALGDTAADTLTSALSSGYGREQEFEADRVGMDYAIAAGYSPKGCVEALQTLQNEAAWVASVMTGQGLTPPKQHGIFASHPDNVERLKKVSAQGKALSAKPLAPLADYLGQIQGVRFGAAERMGAQRGDKFYDGLHQWVMAVPRGWYIGQSVEDRAVVFNAPLSAASIVFQSMELNEKMNAEDFVKTYLSGARFDGKTRKLGGRSVWRGTADLGKDPYQVIGWTEGKNDKEVGFLVVGQRPGTK